MPLTDLDAGRMWRRLIGAAASGPVNTVALEDLTLRLSDLAGTHPEIAELDHLVGRDS